MVSEIEKNSDMGKKAGGDPRRGLFLALESFAGSAALLLDSTGNLEYGNQDACDLLDCAGEYPLNARWNEVVPLFHLPLHSPPATPLLCSAQIPIGGGSRLLSLELHALDASVGRGYFALLKDRSVLDHLERELYLASERRGWNYQCAAFMHDLKGILNSMQISLELLSNADIESTDVSPEEIRRQRCISTLKDDLARMNRALRSLPGTEGDSDPVVTEFDARHLIMEIFTVLRHLVRRNRVELTFDLPQTPLPARGRVAWIRQALFNVAVHRLNAMRAGGRLAVEAETTDQGVVVKMSNDVPDMREGMIDQSYRLSCRGRKSGGATDLQVARSILESQGCTMDIIAGSVDSTSFVMRLPR